MHRSTTPSQNPVRSERGHISLFTDWIQRSRSADESSLSVSVDPTAIQHQQVSLTNLGQGDVTRTDTDKCKSDCQGLEGDKRQVGHGDLNSGLKGDVMTDDPEEGNNCRVDQAAKPAKALEVDVDQVTVDFAEEEKTVGRMIQSPVRDLERGDCPADKTDEEGLTDHSNSVDPVDPAGAKTLTDYTQVAEQAVKERKEEGYPEVNQRDLCVEVKHTLSQVPAVQTRSEQDLMVVETAFGTQSDIHTDSLTVDGDLVNRAVAGDTSMPSSSSPANCTALSLLSSNQTAAEDQESGINAMNNGTACSKVYAGVAGDTGDSRLQTQEPVQLSPDLPHNDSSSSDPEGEVKERKYNSHSASQLSGPALATFSFWTEKLCSFSSTAAPVPSPMFSPKLMALAFTVPVMCDKVQRRPLACFETILKANPLLRELRLNVSCHVGDLFVCVFIFLASLLMFSFIVIIIIIIVVIIMVIIINSNNNNNNNNHIQRRNLRFLTISSLHREPSPTRTLKWPGRNHVQITCNSSSAYHMQHIVLHATWYKETTQLLSLTDFKSHLLFYLYFIG